MKADIELQQDVLEELRWDPSVNAAQIGVTVKDGVITLTGHVPSLFDRYAAERAARRVHGVKAIANELDVKLPESSQRTDEDIAIAAASALRSNTQLPADRVKVTVSGGWLKLEGEVDWQYQKEAAERAVRNLPGVVGVSNLITIKPVVSPANLKAKIERAFQRSAEMDARRIRVEVQGSKVILRGWVYSLAEKREAERAAWSAPGVSEVEVQIIVTRRKPAWVAAASLVVVLAVLFAMFVWPGFLFSPLLNWPLLRAPEVRLDERGRPRSGWPTDMRIEADPHVKPVSDREK